MVRTFDFHKSSSFKFKKMLFDIPGRHQSSSGLTAAEIGGGASPFHPRSQCGSPVGSASPFRGATTPSRSIKEQAEKSPTTDIEVMKQKFARLLLGEDMSGGAKGVSSALALSSEMTNLAASVLGEHMKLEPMNPEKKARWRKERDWLLSVTDHIVELVPSQQQSPDGSIMEVMVTRQRQDLQVNIPALRKLDTMLIDCLDNFRDQNEFWYVEPKDDDEWEKNSQRSVQTWWVPTVEVPPNGLSEITRKWLQHQKESVNQVLKAALSINAQILAEMEIPESYIESLPRNGRDTLGESIYKSITDEFFDPDHFIDSLDLSSESKVLNLKNRIEASIVIWKRKMVQKDGKSSWGSAVSLEKRELFEDRAETILLILKHHFPETPQSALDVYKIQHNKNVGHAVLESYSRVLECLATAVICRIDDVLNADALARNSSAEPNKRISACSIEKTSVDETQASMTLLDFMGWTLDHGDQDGKKRNSTTCQTDDLVNSSSSKEEENKEQENGKIMNVVIGKAQAPPLEVRKLSYLDRLENWGGMRSPTARH